MATNQKGGARNYVFTLNNYTDVEVAHINKATEVEENTIDYVCYGKEVGEKNTPHLQGYLECGRTMRYTAVHKVPGFARVRLAARMGTQTEAITYCKKDGDFYEYGVKKRDRAAQNKNLKQERLKIIHAAIKEGKKEDELFEIDPLICVLHEKWIIRQINKQKPRRINTLKVYLFVGRPGRGKTRLAKKVFPDIYDPPIGKDLWFDQYTGEKQVLMDDFSGNIRLVDALRLFDRYPIKVPVKGSNTWFAPEVIIITTNVHPKDWYDYTSRQDSAAALRRRITEVWNFDKILDGRPTIYKTDAYWLIPDIFDDYFVEEIDYDAFEENTL